MEEKNIYWDEKIAELIARAKTLSVGYAKEWIENLKKYDTVCIFGVGQHGSTWFNILKKCNVQVDFCCDNNSDKWGQEIFEGVICISPDQVKRKCEKIAFVIALRNYKDVYEQVKGWGREEDIFIGSINHISFLTNYEYIGNPPKLDGIYERAMTVINLCSDELSKEIYYQMLYKFFIDLEYNMIYNGEAYFFMKEIPLSANEYLVDAGAYDGDTIRSFEKAVSNQYEKIYAFEMDKRNYHNLQTTCREAIEETGKVELYNIGISNKIGIMHYNSSFETSKFETDGTEICQIDTLDHILGDKKVTFIKMDIEGSEMQALEGAVQIIKKQAPTLAICIYHSIDDLLNIPVYIKEINPNYKIMIRHHSTAEAETICYAIPDYRKE